MAEEAHGAFAVGGELAELRPEALGVQPVPTCMWRWMHAVMVERFDAAGPWPKLLSTTGNAMKGEGNCRTRCLGRWSFAHLTLSSAQVKATCRLQITLLYSPRCKQRLSMGGFTRCQLSGAGTQVSMQLGTACQSGQTLAGATAADEEHVPSSPGSRHSLKQVVRVGAPVPQWARQALQSQATQMSVTVIVTGPVTGGRTEHM